MRKHAERARAVSDKILQDFKTVDGSLQKSNDSLLKQNDSTLNLLKQLQDADSSKLP
ncbi:MAG: hypothetical protein IPP72_17855 [Chitinophagaceae bacterium]|nr:hypothetical protein [Chitinophagaceae bacterium]